MESVVGAVREGLVLILGGSIIARRPTHPRVLDKMSGSGRNSPDLGRCGLQVRSSLTNRFSP
jgi:hypothetical protein